ncbi:hypothetical protein JHK87_042204 [Glycine soja]|nr:hypothetical protein JHK87_042204 [Glycine soja]
MVGHRKPTQTPFAFFLLLSETLLASLNSLTVLRRPPHYRIKSCNNTALVCCGVSSLFCRREVSKQKHLQ